MQGLLITFNRHITIVKENINFIIYSHKRLPSLLFCLKEVIPESKLRNILIIVCVRLWRNTRMEVRGHFVLSFHLSWVGSVELRLSGLRRQHLYHLGHLNSPNSRI